jgi:hypothetical protein
MKRLPIVATAQARLRKALAKVAAGGITAGVIERVFEAK